MVAHERFHYKTSEDLIKQIKELGLSIPYDEDTAVLFDSIKIANHQLANRFVVNPMEGFDADTFGSPQNLSFRRYQRYAAGGSALIWFEATAVVPEARSNPHQFYIHKNNVAVYKKLVEETLRAANESIEQRPMLLLQLTHSGRYSKPEGRPQPIIAHHSEILDPKHQLPSDYPLIPDEALDALQEKYLEAAELAFEAGFDGVDVKACHRYLVSELLASFTRENSRYGGSFENRIRFLVETFTKIKQKFPEKIISTRLNVFDAMSFPYGFGVSETDYHVPDLTEPMKLVAKLKEFGLPLINVSIGNPYFNPHFGRPYDFPIRNVKVPEEHPLVGIGRFLMITREIQKAQPDLPVVGSGYTWLRQFMPNVAAAIVKQGGATLIGQGRGMFAYPDSVMQLREKGNLNPQKVCVTCSACTQLMRDGSKTGCVVRDSEIYGPVFREVRRRARDILRDEALRCRDCMYPSCQDACPAGVDIPNFIKAYANGDIPKAYFHLSKNNLLPEICAYVCPADVQCEGGCIEKIFTGNPIRIRDIQAEVAQEARKLGLVKLNVPAQKSGKQVAIVGAGAAGLTCAASLIQKGHTVTVFDARQQPGGIVRSLLPQNRISTENVDTEVQALLKDVSVDRLSWKLGQPLNIDFKLENLKADFDAVFLAMGLTEGVHLFENPPDSVIDALEFLEKMKIGNGFKIPSQVAVIGGGNTAMDAALLAHESGARDVYLIYRRSFAELPAWPAERNQALNAGVHFLILSQPVGYLADESNQVKAIKLARTRLGEPDESRRRRPEIIPGDESVLPVGMVIEAIGQQPPENLAQILSGVNLTRKRLVQLQPDSQATSLSGVYAGGDIVNGGATAVQAVADGIRAANEIDAYLSPQEKIHEEERE